jgi:two-component system LytT family response regulator
MYKTVIVDDDQLSRLTLKCILKDNLTDIVIVGEADSVASGVALINKEAPDLLFLDIEMPDGTGFQLLEQLSDINFKIILTTSHSDYAITAFKYSAFDYLVKPIQITDVAATINRIAEIPTIHEKTQIEVLKTNLSRVGDDNATIAVPEINGFSIVKIKDIIRCEGERNYSRLFFHDGRSILVSRTLLEFDNMLVEHGFTRIHRSHLINLRNVNRYLKTDGGMVELIDKTVLPVSPKYKDELLNKLLYNRV